MKPVTTSNNMQWMITAPLYMYTACNMHILECLICRTIYILLSIVIFQEFHVSYWQPQLSCLSAELLKAVHGFGIMPCIGTSLWCQHKLKSYLSFLNCCPWLTTFEKWPSGTIVCFIKCSKSKSKLDSWKELTYFLHQAGNHISYF